MGQRVATTRRGVARFLQGAGCIPARLRALTGTLEWEDKSPAVLREAVDSGWRIGWRMHLRHNPELARLHAEPEFQALVAELEAEMTAQIKRIREHGARAELPSTSGCCEAVSGSPFRL